MVNNQRGKTRPNERKPIHLYYFSTEKTPSKVQWNTVGGGEDLDQVEWMETSRIRVFYFPPFSDFTGGLRKKKSGATGGPRRLIEASIKLTPLAHGPFTRLAATKWPAATSPSSSPTAPCWWREARDFWAKCWWRNCCEHVPISPKSSCSSAPRPAATPAYVSKNWYRARWEFARHFGINLETTSKETFGKLQRNVPTKAKIV